MADEKKTSAGLVELAKAEATFRAKTVEVISGFIKDPDVDSVLKCLVILGLLDVIAFSFILVLAMLELMSDMYNNFRFEALHYAWTLGGLFLALVVIAFPLLQRALQAENAIRIRGDFGTIATSRSQKKRS